MELNVTRYSTACGPDEAVDLFIDDNFETIDIVVFKTWCDKKIKRRITMKEFKKAEIDLIEHYIFEMSLEFSEEEK